MKKKLIIASLIILLLQGLMAEEWYVCLGSFEWKENADIYCELLEKNNLPSWIYLSSTPKGTFYRVLYDVPKGNIEEARRLRDAVAISKGAKALKLEGLWVCSAKSADGIESAIKPEIKKTEPVKAETTKAETVKAATTKTDTTKTDTTKAAPTKTETVKADTTKTETKKSKAKTTDVEEKTTVKTSPVKVEEYPVEPETFVDDEDYEEDYSDDSDEEEYPEAEDLPVNKVVNDDAK